METVGERIKQIRKDKHLTQKVFAEKLRISRSHITNIESMVYRPSNSLIRLISYIFNIDEKWIKDGGKREA